MSGIQAAARTARYRLIGQAMAGDGVELLLTAHQRGDQAETVLMRLAHGSGLTGLRGMEAWAAVEGVLVHRPLLGLDRALLEKIVTESGLVPVRDPGNLDAAYERVRWRRALPGLAGLGIDGAGLARLAGRLNRADAALASATGRLVAEHVRLDAFGVAAIAWPAFCGFEPEFRLRVLRAMLGRVVLDETIRLERAEALLSRLEASDFTLASLAGCVVRRAKSRLLVYREAGRMRAAGLHLGPGQTTIWDRRFSFTNASGETVAIAMADHVTRADAERFAGTVIDAPMHAVRAAPLARNAAGTLIALGTISSDPRLRVGLSAPELAVN